MAPSVSILTATHNRSELLSRAIESVRSQEHQDYEHLVLDDGSTDETPEIMAEYSEDTRIRYIQFEENRGPAAVWNDGIERANGEYITFLDDDDEYLEGRLTATVETLDRLNRRFVGVYHGYHLDLADRSHYYHVQPGELTHQQFQQQNAIAGNSNTMYCRSVLCEVGGFDEQFEAEIDHDLQYRVLEQGPLWGIPEILSNHGGQIKGIQKNHQRLYNGVGRLLEKHSDDFSPQKAVKYHRKRATAADAVGQADVGAKHRARARVLEQLSQFDESSISK